MPTENGKISLVKTPAQSFSRRLVSLKQIQLIQKDFIISPVQKSEVKIAYLNNSYVFHLVVYWQAFVENLVRYAFESIPNRDEADPEHAAAVERMDKAIHDFNTPDKQNVDRIVRKNLGVKRITKSWKSDDADPFADTHALRNLIKARHQIAHTGFTSQELSFDSNFEIMESVFRIACRMETALLSELQQAESERGGSEPTPLPMM